MNEILDLTEEPQTIQDFLASNPVQLTLTRVPVNPHMDSEEMINYLAVLTFEGRSMSVFFSTGAGWIQQKAKTNWLGFGVVATPADRRRLLREPVRYNAKENRFFIAKRGVTMWENEIINILYEVKTPTAADILDNLATDASFVEGVTFEDWCDSLGYDSDSRKAFQTFEVCLKQARETRQLLGRAKFDELMNKTERL